MGDFAFGQMANELTRGPGLFNRLIDYCEYQRWKKHYTFETLKQRVRYGQSFCNSFDITDNILYYEQDPERADDRIRNCYVV